MDRAELLGELERHLVRITRVANSRASAHHRQTRSKVMISRLHAAILVSLEHVALRVTELANELDVEIAVASREVRVLVEQNLVSRRDDPDDARAALLAITRAGRGALRRYREAANEILGETLSHWDDHELEVLVGYLERLSSDFVRPPR